MLGPFISLSDNGQVAIGTIHDGTFERHRFGAILSGPTTGPLQVLRGLEPDTHPRRYLLDNDLDISNSGAVAVLLSQNLPNFPAEAGNIAIYSRPNQTIETTPYALESHNTLLVNMAMNNLQTVAMSSNVEIPYRCRRERDRMASSECPPSTVPAGVYRSEATSLGAPKRLTPIANFTAEGYCWFGNVDINDSNNIVFEARTTHESGDCMRSPIEIFSGSDPISSRVVAYADTNLESHQFYDKVVLGYINNANQVSFMTTYSEPLVHTHHVWRTDLDELGLGSASDERTRTTESPGLLRAIILFFTDLWAWFTGLFG
jgi:hypothetical protein